MRIGIYVVLTELEKARLLSGDIQGLKCLNEQREKLIALFHGLTEIDFTGYWRDGDYTEKDFGKIWIIYTSDEAFHYYNDELFDILRTIRALTKQKCQAFSVNDDMEMI